MNHFNEMPLHADIQKALKALEFTTPTEVQAKTIETSLKGRDLMVCAQTGSGKTGAYLIPMLERLISRSGTSGLVLAPTRELALQIADFAKSLVRFHRSIEVVLLVGGVDIKKQFRILKSRPRLVIATPGRLFDHLERKSINLSRLTSLVLDEGDRMLDMGFAPQLDRILKFLPRNRQSSLYTATLPKAIRTLSQKYLSDAKCVEIGESNVPVEKIRQSVIEVEQNDKKAKIIDELCERKGSVIVFTRTQRRTDALAKQLSQYGFEVSRIHGGRTQGQRNTAIKNFKNGKCRVLCATDVAARGIDVPEVAHVINFDLPDMHEDYVHRIGRTARNGADGCAISFVTPQEHRSWNQIARTYKISGVELKGQADDSADEGRRQRRRGPRRRPQQRHGQGRPSRRRSSSRARSAHR